MGDNSDATQSCQQLPFLPEELIFEILSWLPVRCLLEFKRVCKSWQTIISHPIFANNHLRNLTINPSMTHQRVFCLMINHKTEIVSFPMKPLLETSSEPTEPIEFNMEHKFRILGSYNGLLCLFHVDQGYVKLCNPCIRFDSKKSPTLDCYDKDTEIIDSGFGYDHVNEKYKVLVVVGRWNPYFWDRMTRIYTFGENSWKTIKNFPCCVPLKIEGKFVSGTLNWGAIKRGVGSTSFNQSVILSFDLEEETYKELLLPDDDGVKLNNYVLGVMSNCLCVGFTCNKKNWNLWVMKKYGVTESWTRLIMIPYEQLLSPLTYLFYFAKPLFILENNIVLFSTDTKFVLLNLNNGRVDDCLLGSPYIGSKQYIYSASLISPQL